MKIKKKSQSVGVLGKILNIFSNSDKDTYSCDYLNNNDAYSTDEIKTNKRWIDGKPIYRTVVTTNSYSDRLNTGISNLETMIKMEVLVSQSSNGDWRNIPWLFNSGGVIGDQSWAGGVLYKMNDNQLHFQIGSSLKNAKKIVAILEYTKTTD